MFGLGDSGSDFAKSVTQQQQGLQGDSWKQFLDLITQVRGGIDPYLSGKVGFDPAQLALMKSQFLNTVAGKYQNAGANVRTALARAGSAGNGPVGGDYARGIAGLEGATADTASSGLMGIDLSNLEQALNNKFKALGTMQGNAGMMGDWGKTFTGGMDAGLGAFAKLKSSELENSPMTKLTGAFGNALGDILGKGVGGKLGGLFGKNPSGGK